MTWRGTNEGRHPWFTEEGRPQTEEEKRLIEEAMVPRPDSRQEDGDEG